MTLLFLPLESLPEWADTFYGLYSEPYLPESASARTRVSRTLPLIWRHLPKKGSGSWTCVAALARIFSHLKGLGTIHLYAGCVQNSFLSQQARVSVGKSFTPRRNARIVGIGTGASQMRWRPSRQCLHGASPLDTGCSYCGLPL
jgi:hypothetical protein